MDFEQLVCYSQAVIILVLLVGYIINSQNKDRLVTSKTKLKCSSCSQDLLGDDPNYCSYCGHMNSHSKGSNLGKSR